MIVFNDDVLEQCSAKELASLLEVATAHNVVSVTDTARENREAIKAYLQKRKLQAEDETLYIQELEKRFV